MSFLRVLAVVVLAINLGCNSAAKKDGAAGGDGSADTAAAGKEGPWQGQMQNMAADVKRLLPFLYDREAFHDPKNKEAVHSALKQFSAVAHKIKPETGKKFLGDDLLVEYSLASLSDDLGRSLHAFEAGQLEYSRSVAKASISYCFQCHSATQGTNSAAWELDQLQNLNLAPLEKADLLVALRKFDKALTFMESQLNSPEFLKNYGFDFESMLRRYLALIIRVENKPRRALTR
ncbi:MAG: hypothetical protein ACXVA9_08320 [Bdellovibrionales bacterium]